jgi:hypothetical protein
MSRISQIPNPWPGPDFTLTFKTPKLKTLLWIVVFLFFVVGGFWGDTKKNVLIIYLCSGFFALGIVVFCVQLLPGASYLILKKESFIFCALFRAHEVRWDEVQDFRVQTISHNKMVVWDFVLGYSKQVRGRRISTAMAGCEGALPETYGFKAEELAEVMDQMKECSLIEGRAVES